MAATVIASLGAQAPATAPAAKASADPALPPARQILDRHIKAIGGREALMSHKSAHQTGTFSVPSSGMVGTVEMFGATDPDRLLMRITIPGLGEMSNGFDGSHGWSITPMTGPMLQVGKELDQTKLDAAFYAELRDPKNYTSIKTIEKTSFEGRPCYKVSLVRIDGNEDFEFYDVETGLRAGSIATRESPMGKVTTTSVEGDYKKFGNILQATTLVQKMMGVEQKLTLTGVEYDNVAPTVFELPEPIKALIK
ncbi:MAG TPA: hypothetical protein VH458_20135 [Vicinamibacterales bacterium]